MVSMIQRGLIFVALLLLPGLALAADAPTEMTGLEYHRWIQEQNAARARGEQPAQQGQTTQQSGDGAYNFELDYHKRINFTAFFDRLRFLLTDPQWFGQTAELAEITAMLESEGKFNLKEARESLTINDDLLRYTIETEYADLPPGSFKGQLYSLPNRPFASANYVTDDVMLYTGFQNVPQSAFTILDQLAKHPEALQEGLLADILDEVGGGGPDDLDIAQVAAMAGFARPTIENLLTGEVAAAFYGFSDMGRVMQGDIEPGDINAVLFLGIKDSAAVAQMLTSVGGEAGLVAQGSEGGWQYFGLDADEVPVRLALGSDILMATVSDSVLRGAIARSGSPLPAPAGQYHIHVNLDQLCQLVTPLVQMAEHGVIDRDYLAAEFDEYGWPSVDKLDAALRYLLDIDHLGGAGSLDISGSYHSGYRSELTMKPAVFIYLAYTVGRLGGMAAMQHHLRDMHEGMEEYGEDGAMMEEEQDYLDSRGGGAGGSYNYEAEPAEAGDGDYSLPGGEDDLK